MSRFFYSYFVFLRLTILTVMLYNRLSFGTRTLLEDKNMENKDLPREGFVRMEQIVYATGLSKATLYNHIKSGTFPAPQKVGKISRWPVGQVRAIIAAQGGTVQSDLL